MWTSRSLPLFALSLTSTVLIFGGGLLLLKQSTEQIILPNIYIDSLNLGNKSSQEAEKALTEAELANLSNFQVKIFVDDIAIASTSAELKGQHNYQQAIQTAIEINKSDFWPWGILRALNIYAPKKEITSKYVFDQEKLANMISELKKKVDIAGQDPAATLSFSGSPASLKIQVGKVGREIDVQKTVERVLNDAKSSELFVEAHVASTAAELNQEQVNLSLQRAKKIVNKKLIFRADNFFTELADTQLVNLLQLPQGISAQKKQNLIDTWKKEVNRAPQDAKFEYDKNSLNVTSFAPPRKGLTIDQNKLNSLLLQAFDSLENSSQSAQEIQLPVAELEPQKKLADTNDLGIQEEIGFGESQYAHSIPNRIHNVTLTANKVNNIIVKPGEEFSFNKALGEVSSATGFKSAYVIKNGKTELGDGGGVCQVSTTLFRAVLNAGLPVTKRKAHSYRVSYYELNAKPGIDATVYAGDVDLRFINDTGKYLLIHTQTDPQKLYMTIELFGTSDGRTTDIVDHKTWGYAPAPAPLYIDDPTLKHGQIRQIDFPASGIKASFKNIIKDKDGKTIREEEYISNYQPWRAVYLRGTGW